MCISANSEKVASDKRDVMQLTYAKPICISHFLGPEDLICRTAEYLQYQLLSRESVQLTTILTNLKKSLTRQTGCLSMKPKLRDTFDHHSVMKLNATVFARLPDTTVLKNMAKLMKVLVTLSAVYSKQT